MAPNDRDRLSLSPQARSLWGKSDYGEGTHWLPLYMHLLDTAGIAGHLWDGWLPLGTRDRLVAALGGDAVMARKLACFLVGAHDLGKATPAFQGKPCGRPGEESAGLDWKPRRAGLPIRPDLSVHHATAHPCASHILLCDILTRVYGWDLPCAESLAAVAGSHHGKPPELKDVRPPFRIRNERPPAFFDLGWDADAWLPVQEELCALVAQAVALSHDDLASLAHVHIPAPAASLLAGLSIMADWLASDEELFPLVPLFPEDHDVASGRSEPSVWNDVHAAVQRAWTCVGLVPPWCPCGAEARPIDDLYRERFGFSEAMSPRPVQRAAVEVAHTVATPGLMIVEAPMGEGKTEAALAAAEVLAARTGRSGVCVALPTMATTDAMFGRVHRWLDRLPHREGADGRSVFLAHGKARLNEEFEGMVRVRGPRYLHAMGEDLADDPDELPDAVVVSQWMQGRKKGMLANFVVCTIDQVLMGALQMKHLPLRQLSLANKVVVIDECHAYDAYMRCYLNRVLEWLGSLGVPVVLLSATLPEAQRAEMLEGYRGGQLCTAGAPSAGAPGRPRRRFARGLSPQELPEPSGEKPAGPVDAYPLITYTDGARDCRIAPAPSGRSLNVRLNMLPDAEDALAALLRERLAQGGCAGVICTTVTRAQRTARALRDALGGTDVVLTHARFTDLDRMANEKRLRDLLGPQATRENGHRPERLVVVGTQVLEQSLDIDFDMLVSDVAPVDLIMQRLGRLHRHCRTRPQALVRATCWLRGIERWEPDGPAFAPGIADVYPAATLLEALGVLGLTGEGVSYDARLPGDIARTVRDAYGGRAVLPGAWRERYEREREKRADGISRKRGRASACLLVGAGYLVRNERSLVDWYSPKVVEGHDQDRGPRAVRDTGETVEVLALERREGRLWLLPWVGDERAGVEPGAPIDTDWAPEDAVARLAAQSAVRLPLSLCRPEELDALIKELEAACDRYVGAWQGSPWLAGCLALLLERDDRGCLSTAVHGRRVVYDRGEGLVVEPAEARMEGFPS